LQNNPNVSEDLTRELEFGLSMTISLTVEQKQKVMESYPRLSSEQVSELLRIFIEEQLKIALLGPSQQPQLGEIVGSIWKNQEKLLQV
jgi:hypothetical protein